MAAGDELSGGSPGGVSGPDAVVSIDEQGTLALAPGDVTTVHVSAKPAASYEMSFALIGDAADASLDKTTVIADPGGHASVVLRAPNTATTFRLRASIKQGPSTEIGVAVSDEGFGTVRVVPVYGGKRKVTDWYASVVARTTCAAVASSLPSDPEGALKEKGAPGDDLLVENAPVGPNLAVIVRAGHYMWGCTDEPHLVAMTTADVKVNVIDRPMDLSATDLDVGLSYAPDPGPYGQILADASSMLLEHFAPAAQPFGSLVLDAMADATGADLAPAFGDARSGKGWDATANDYFSGVALRDAAAAWANAGLAAQKGQLLGHLTAIGDTAGEALFAVSTLGSVDAAAAGVPGAHLVSWTADSSDTVLLVGALFWMPSRYVGAAALAGAQAAWPAATSVPEALASEAGCDGLAAALGGFGACDVGCTSKLCGAALAARWEKGLEASADEGSIGGISVTASGPAQVGDMAEPLAFDGVWLGTVTDGKTTADVKGQASGIGPEPVAPPN